MRSRSDTVSRMLPFSSRIARSFTKWVMAGRESDDPQRAYPGNRPSATILLEQQLEIGRMIQLLRDFGDLRLLIFAVGLLLKGKGGKCKQLTAGGTFAKAKSCRSW